jgi:hypothetical protein
MWYIPRAELTAFAARLRSRGAVPIKRGAR